MISTLPHDALPTLQDPSGLCPNPQCGKYVEFGHPPSWGTQDDMIWPRYQAATVTTHPSRIPEVAIRLAVWLCPACRETCVVFTRQKIKRTVEEDGTSYQSFDETPILIWPARRPRELEAAVPEKIRELFVEGSVAEHAGALRAAAALYRATVEEICADRSAQGKNLDQKINDLKNRGVDAGIVDDLHEARLMGNWSLHQGEPFAAEEVADVADLIVEATVVLYVQPEERRRMREARRARRTKSGTGV